VFAKIEPTGTFISHNKVQFLISFFLDKQDDGYEEKQDVAFHSHFIYVDTVLKEKDVRELMQTHLAEFYPIWSKKYKKDKV